MGGRDEGMSKFAGDLVQGLTEAVDFARAARPLRTGARVHVVMAPDVRAIRRKLHMSQHEFADAFRIPLATIKNWEQGRRVPDAPAAAYLHAIARQPQAIRDALQNG
jgi:putative transcriptional regulator